MAIKIPSWEAEFWSYLIHGNGMTCPMYKSCQHRLGENRCIFESEEIFNRRNEITEYDEIHEFVPAIINNTKLYECLTVGRIFELGIRLADRYRREIEFDNEHTTTSIVIKSISNIHIEVRRVPLKAHFGAVWNLGDCWVIQLNSNNSSGSQRYTLYHEIFHILAYYHAGNVLEKTYRHNSNFNEFLANHFAAVSLMPRKLLRERWKEIRDISQMAVSFDVPIAVMYRGLLQLGLIYPSQNLTLTQKQYQPKLENSDFPGPHGFDNIASASDCQGSYAVASSEA